MGNLNVSNPSELPDRVTEIQNAVVADEVILAELQAGVAATAPANEVIAGPASGSPAVPAARALVSNDLPPVITPKVIYSAAGTPLPAASDALIGASAVVSDATTPTYLGPMSAVERSWRACCALA